MADKTHQTPERDRETAVRFGRGLSRREALTSAAAGVAALSGTSLLSACGSSGSGGTISPAASKPVRGGTLTVAMISHGSAETLSVWQASTDLDECRIFSLYDPLFEFDATGPRPALAESAEPNADASTWTFQLRKGVTWHDGTPFTAADVVYTIQNWINPQNYYSYTIGAVVDAKKVRKLDDYTVELPLHFPVADLPSFSAFYEGYVIKAGTTEKDFNTKPIGTGPFELVSFVPGQQSVFRANHSYWREGLPYLDKLVVDSSFTDDTARVGALESGTADTVPEMPFGLARANASSKSIRIESYVGASCYQFTMNLEQPPFTDVRVRQAMRLIADRPGIIEGALAGYGTPGNDLPGSKLPYFASDLKRERDLEQARFLLKQAGHSNLAVTLISSNINSGLPDCATLFAQNAAEAGVKVNVKTIEPSIFYTSSGGYLKRAFSVGCPGQGNDVPSLSEYYLITVWSNAAYPETHFADPAFDKLLLDAVGELDPAKATDKWHEVQQVQFDSGGYLIFSNLAYVDAYGTTVDGVQPTLAGFSNGFQFRTAWKS